MLYNSSDDIFRISKIHSRQLIIFCFSLFSPQKNKLQSQQKINYTDKYRRVGLSWKCRNNGLFISLDGWDISKKPIFSAKKYKKIAKKNFDLVLLKKPIFFIFLFFHWMIARPLGNKNVPGFPV